MTRIFRSLAVVLAAAIGTAALLPPGPARAENPEIFANFRNGVAIFGYDPVAYFTDGAAREGDPAHALEWKGATWHFVSAENRDAFAANPERYAPQYGGYCAYAIAKGSAKEADPKVFTIVDDKLYLNLSPNVKKVWEEDMHDLIVSADNNWPEALIQKGRTKFEPNKADR